MEILINLLRKVLKINNEKIKFLNFILFLTILFLLLIILSTTGLKLKNLIILFQKN